VKAIAPFFATFGDPSISGVHWACFIADLGGGVSPPASLKSNTIVVVVVGVDGRGDDTEGTFFTLLMASLNCIFPMAVAIETGFLESLGGESESEKKQHYIVTFIEHASGL
jgi:hypothetical protein